MGTKVVVDTTRSRPSSCKLVSPSREKLSWFVNTAVTTGSVIPIAPLVVVIAESFSLITSIESVVSLVDDDGWLEERWIVVLLVLESSEPNALSVLDELVDKNIPDEDDTNERTLDGDTGSKTARSVTLNTEESVDETSRCASDDPADTAGADFTDESLDEIPSDSPTDLGDGTIDELLCLLYAIDELFESFDPIEPLESIGPIELT
ncbi:hypothetical protein AmFV_239 [Apis mellifera filamentous virus]|uniref:hypothetical protein n=1 Tax=Apis mellifera filamentous virus TaxID=1100043 RepID=UPI0006BCD9B9|nr:hypothetical protein APL35_gp239 [Apis mellifera filamentous virus]UQL06698.1 hypothetical protein AmFV_239 [Apis mellifera filamentous virus]WLJ60435.1 MAG: hypothetical protein AmFV_00284 [Apis mellifera filamentous virus]